MRRREWWNTIIAFSSPGRVPRWMNGPGRPAGLGLVAHSLRHHAPVHFMLLFAVLSQHTSIMHLLLELILTSATYHRRATTLLPNVYSLGAFAFYLGERAEAMDRASERGTCTNHLDAPLVCVLFLFLSVLFHLGRVPQ
jgi:hypothetical protein